MRKRFLFLLLAVLLIAFTAPSFFPEHLQNPWVTLKRLLPLSEKQQQAIAQLNSGKTLARQGETLGYQGHWYKALALHQQAVTHFKNALTLDADSFEAAFYLGASFSHQAFIETFLNRAEVSESLHLQASAEYQRALKINPNFAGAAGSLGISFIRLAEFRHMENKNAQADDFYRQAADQLALELKNTPLAKSWIFALWSDVLMRRAALAAESGDVEKSAAFTAEASEKLNQETNAPPIFCPVTPNLTTI